MAADISAANATPSPVFVLLAAGEDDGYLMVYVTKPDGTSYMHVYDAATMDATPVAEVRVCSGC
jgi:carotenoid cleavage dioxygenase-like enzyme